MVDEPFIQSTHILSSPNASAGTGAGRSSSPHSVILMSLHSMCHAFQSLFSQVLYYATAFLLVPKDVGSALERLPLACDP